MERIKLQPQFDRVAVKLIETKETPGGILLPDSADKGRVVKGTVVAVGHGALRESDGKLSPMMFKVGEVVYLSAYSGHEIEVGKEKYHIVAQLDIIATEV
jgi:co-chaperonin GroES (HSP10)